jgi:16S rRNA (adenine1518-N6/adenine1519-N6)-dimethyltransferase
LLNSLQSTGIPKEKIRECLESAEIDSRRRAETLSLEEFAALADRITERGYDRI